MSPSYSVKTGVRYRFYVSAALLRGRKSEAGSLTRVSATQIEQAVLEATRQRAPANPESTPNALIETFVERIEIGRNRLKITFKDMESSERPEVLELPWSTASSNLTSIEECPSGERQPDQKLIETLARGHSRDFNRHVSSTGTGWLATQWDSNQSLRAFTANREFYREMRDLRATKVEITCIKPLCRATFFIFAWEI